MTPLFAQDAGAPLLDPPTRAVLAMALLAFVLLGLGLMAGAMLGGRWVRRLGGDRLREPLPLRKPASVEGPHWAEGPVASDARPTHAERRTAVDTAADRPAVDDETLPG
ncbi:MAG: hypothetical protein AAF805_04570 [Planctomycetota bacterium]